MSTERIRNLIDRLILAGGKVSVQGIYLYIDVNGSNEARNILLAETDVDSPRGVAFNLRELMNLPSAASAILAFDDYETKRQAMHKVIQKAYEEMGRTMVKIVAEHEAKHLFDALKAEPMRRVPSNEPWRRNGKKRGCRK